ncbi:aldo/keto reductase [Nocardiopsis tropica]|uniref:Aldo/keto reductase n=1 Tax=Nocardiopsis tropica TaxID=109330 RepID=A0ABU7KIK6_9ACTN|nr:aldo/keto reductase [Nocardiopsis umidischolae]MEE2049120.1 aldo/keto reductase [Nocardiopsis umidischolae]
MRYELLGSTGLRVSEMFLGAMLPGDGAGLAAVVDAYADAGGNVLDTAVNYAGGRSEEALGEILEGRRDRFVLSTKYTLSRDETDPNAAGNHRKNLVRSLETSLRRLRTDHVDLYWVHLWDRHTPIEETVRALDDAVRAGKVLYVGISNAPAWVAVRANTLAEWRDWTPFSAVQVNYSLLNRDVEREILPAADHLGMSVAAWSPLAGGALAGGARGGPAPTGADGARERITGAVAEVAAELGATPAQVALAWLRSRSPNVHPITGAATAAQVAENVRALALDLPEEAAHRLDEVSRIGLGYPHDFVAEHRRAALGRAALPLRSRLPLGRG